MKALLAGYTGEIYLNGIPALMTSYGLSLETNMIKSNASYKLTNWSGDFVYRHSLQPLRDFPVYSLSITIQLTSEICNELLDRLTQDFKEPMGVKFYDDYKEIEFYFEECYVTKFELSVEKDNVAVAALSFVYFNETFEFSSGNIKNKYQYGSNRGKSSLIGSVLMPYYSWGINLEHDVVDFSFSFQRNVNPKFGCVGDSSYKAVKPIGIVMGLPAINFQCTLAMINQFNLKDIDNYFYSNYVDKKDIEIFYKNNKKLELIECYPDSYTPIVGNRSEIVMLSIYWSVYGIMK